MLTDNRKRRHSDGDEGDGQLVPQAKRSSRTQPLSPELGRDAVDSELSNSVSSGISSPGHAAGSSSSSSSQCALDIYKGSMAPGPYSPLVSAHSSELTVPTDLVSYDQINRILREAHFESLQSRGQPRDT